MEWIPWAGQPDANGQEDATSVSMRIENSTGFEQRWLDVVERCQIPRRLRSHVVGRGRLSQHLNMTRTSTKDAVDKEARMTHILALWNAFVCVC